MNLEEKDKKTLLRLFKNILQHPVNDKFKNLNRNRICKLFSNKQICLHLLHQAGFYDSVDKRRLLYDNDKLHELQEINTKLLSAQSQNSKCLNKSISDFKFDPCANIGAPDSFYLFDSRSVSNQLSNPVCPLQPAECLCVKILIKILTFYDRYLHEPVDQTIYDAVYAKIGNNYTNTDLLDDFNHILLQHYTQFEQIYNILNLHIYNSVGCDLAKCILMKRSQRDRAQITRNEELLKQLYFDNDDIIEQQLLDRIHCYFFHTFDIGYRIKEHEKYLINDHETKNDVDDIDDSIYDPVVSHIRNLTNKKLKQRFKIKGLNRLNQINDKFSSNNLQCTTNQYSYGYRYFYWHFYKDNVFPYDSAGSFSSIATTQYASNQGSPLRCWYIAPKYSTLKEELLFNSIYCIGETQWRCLVNKAQSFIGTEKVKSLFCPRKQSAIYYEMQYGEIMRQDHLIAMILYCGYTMMQFKLSETFRKLNKTETDDQMKDRHKNFCLWSRLLRECVECFGMYAEGINDILLYHGVTQQFAFSSTLAYIKGPISTTTQYTVAAQFSQYHGMILEMRINTLSWVYKHFEGDDALGRITCFDCHWISDFCNEQEVFCIGGLYSFTFNTIIESNTALNYHAYIAGLEHITLGMSHGHVSGTASLIQNLATTKYEKQMGYRLLSHELWRYCPNNVRAHEFKSCPNYIKNILHAQCRDIRVINIFETGHDVFDWLFKYRNGWINLQLLSTVFPNIETIAFNAPTKNNSFIQQLSLLDNILSFITKQSNVCERSKLTSINIVINAKCIDNVKSHVDKYIKKFNCLSWMVGVMCCENVNTLLANIGYDMVYKKEEELELCKKLQNSEFMPRLAMLGLGNRNSAVILIQKMECPQEMWDAAFMTGIKLGRQATNKYT